MPDEVESQVFVGRFCERRADVRGVGKLFHTCVSRSRCV